MIVSSTPSGRTSGPATEFICKSITWTWPVEIAKYKMNTTFKIISKKMWQIKAIL